MHSLPIAAQVALVGIGGTAILDLWLLVQKRLGLPPTNFALVGRWVGHLSRLRFVHQSIGAAAPIRAELALGWVSHFVVGIAWSALMVVVLGTEWLAAPRPVPALMFGLASAALPLLVVQPAFGAGLCASRTKQPLSGSLRTIVNHGVFGGGLYLAAALLNSVVL